MSKEYNLLLKSLDINFLLSMASDTLAVILVVMAKFKRCLHFPLNEGLVTIISNHFCPWIKFYQKKLTCWCLIPLPLLLSWSSSLWTNLIRIFHISNLNIWKRTMFWFKRLVVLPPYWASYLPCLIEKPLFCCFWEDCL